MDGLVVPFCKVDDGGQVMDGSLSLSGRQLPGHPRRDADGVVIPVLNLGLPDVIHTGWVDERVSRLRLFGPRGTRDMADHLTRAWARDIRIRTEGDQPHTRDGWRVIANDIAPGVVYRDSNVTVTAIPVPHTNWDQAFGYRFETRDKVFVISGDTRPPMRATGVMCWCTRRTRRKSSGSGRQTGRNTTPGRTPRPSSLRRSPRARGRGCWCCITSSTGVPPTMTCSPRFAPDTRARWFRPETWIASRDGNSNQKSQIPDLRSRSMAASETGADRAPTSTSEI